MKDEIKEILYVIRKLVEQSPNRGSYGITHKKWKQLLDYITNLQERKITKEDVNKYFEENMCVSFDKFIENWNEQEEWTNYYKKENEKLKEELQQEKKDFKETNDYCFELKDYKSRNEKATKYIKNTNFWGIYEDVPMSEVKYGDELLDILEGEDKDVKD